MFEIYTRDTIRETILDNTDAPVSTIEGSFSSDMAAPIALELSRVYGQLDMLLNMFFVESITGDYLTIMASEHGVDRKIGTKATGEVTFTGNDSVVIPAETIVLTEDGLRFLTDSAVTITGGSATVTATAAELGDAYNVLSGEITLLYRGISGVTAITNASQFMGGTDTETDDALRARLLERMRQPATSGNAYHFRQWALSTPGVGDAKIFPLWNGNGTVKVILVGNDKQPVDQTIVDAAADYIETVRPIGATVTVESATGTTVDVSATIAIDATTTLSTVQDSYKEALTEYFKNIVFTGSPVSYQRVAYLLLGIPGVVSFATLTVNGGTSDITIASDEVPVLGTVTVSD